jgi:hypothetical protein
MPDPKRPGDKPAETYGDIARRVVPVPDSSYRPSRDDVERAHEPPPPPLEAAADLGELRAGLAAERVDLDDVAFERADDTLVVRGSVATERDRAAIVAAGRKLAGVERVSDELRVRL